MDEKTEDDRRPTEPDRALVERLRFLASGQDDPHSVALSEAADAIERLADDVDRVVEWQQEGEAVFERHGRTSVLFCLGAWWADRPWRRLG